MDDCFPPLGNRIDPIAGSGERTCHTANCVGIVAEIDGRDHRFVESRCRSHSPDRLGKATPDRAVGFMRFGRRPRWREDFAEPRPILLGSVIDKIPQNLECVGSMDELSTHLDTNPCTPARHWIRMGERRLAQNNVAHDISRSMKKCCCLDE